MKDAGLHLKCLYLRCCGGGMQESLYVETLLEVTATLGWGYEVGSKRFLSGVYDSPWR